MSDGNELVDYGHKVMNVDVENWMALQAVHGVIHRAFNKMKYTWFGVGYISNMYFKMIANHAIYRMGKLGGDLTFKGSPCKSVVYNAVGDAEGNPVNNTGW